MSLSAFCARMAALEARLHTLRRLLAKLDARIARAKGGNG